VDTLSSFRPDILWVYPTALSNFLLLMQDAKISLSVPTVFSSSEMMSESLFHHATQSLQARVIDRYGHNERVCSAHCDSSREYRFDRAYGYIELLPDPQAGAPHAPMTVRIIGTGFWNSAFPLVRYDTGDRAIVPDSGDKDSLLRIAKGEQPFYGVIGRADDYIIGRDGARITGMNHVPVELDAVLQIQIIQESEQRIRLLALAKGDLTARDHNKLEENIRKLLPTYMELEIEAVREFVSLANGKTPFIIRKVKDYADAPSRPRTENVDV